jgi:hypothetical protein
LGECGYRSAAIQRVSFIFRTDWHKLPASVTFGSLVSVDRFDTSSGCKRVPRLSSVSRTEVSAKTHAVPKLRTATLSRSGEKSHGYVFFIRIRVSALGRATFMSTSIKPIQIVSGAAAANADQLEQMPRTTPQPGIDTVVEPTIESSGGWDAYEVWRRLIKDARDRRKHRQDSN